jgi:hypothetical protein
MNLRTRKVFYNYYLCSNRNERKRNAGLHRLKLKELKKTGVPLHKPYFKKIKSQFVCLQPRHLLPLSKRLSKIVCNKRLNTFFKLYEHYKFVHGVRDGHFMNMCDRCQKIYDHDDQYVCQTVMLQRIIKGEVIGEVNKH